MLCTVPNQTATLAEIKRILKPDGQFLFLEHVRSPDPDLAKWQDRLEKPWRFLGDGCHCNRDTESAIEAAGFKLSGVEHPELPKAPPIVRPMAKEAPGWPRNLRCLMAGTDVDYPASPVADR